ncbi:uncharacterized protein HD556DRAFT_1460940 [Suillus plorans]|uniref:Uncharacterized protein n=1 Tax=Suillus plorans TaxID=116603 RepID=A0A9P7A9V6_9AGAM|nr:uncharacterized protein HD556DRAFT_1460940 [Suillus plorans]KAG1785001.1 hypothetical protein HD556DRAFT_1460940 [Suillus plorans]
MYVDFQTQYRALSHRVKPRPHPIKFDSLSILCTTTSSSNHVMLKASFKLRRAPLTPRQVLPNLFTGVSVLIAGSSATHATTSSPKPLHRSLCTNINIHALSRVRHLCSSRRRYLHSSTGELAPPRQLIPTSQSASPLANGHVPFTLAVPTPSSPDASTDYITSPLLRQMMLAAADQCACSPSCRATRNEPGGF